jgi:hypothetical protein
MLINTFMKSRLKNKFANHLVQEIVHKVVRRTRRTQIVHKVVRRFLLIIGRGIEQLPAWFAWGVPLLHKPTL